MFSSRQGTFAAPALISSRPWTSVRTEDALFLCWFPPVCCRARGARVFELLTRSGCRVAGGGGEELVPTVAAAH